MKKILVTGALGQIGSELIFELKKKYGNDNVIASDVRADAPAKITESGPYEVIDVLDRTAIENVIKKYEIDTIFHMAALLSAVGEKNPALCWNVNMNGTLNVLELAVQYKLDRIIVPSSIAVWGEGVPKEDVPQRSVLRPTSMYGVTKVAGERLCDYYVQKFGLDVRGLRYPGIISSETLPGGGTTDYAVEIYYEAVKNKKYTSFLKEGTVLPMMYMPDCIKATIDLAEADFDKLVHHSDFNLAAFSFGPEDLAAAIKKHIPEFELDYAPDYRQEIADSWPASIDDSAAASEWNWKPQYDIDSMTKDMIEKLSDKHSKGLI
jgi:nucleoside-diphosphate-sugar epimerase